MSTFNSLPSEIHNLIIQQSHNSDLKSIRLISRELSTLAARQLFSHLTLLPTSTSQERYDSVLAYPHLAQQVRSIEIQTYVIAEFETKSRYDDDIITGDFSEEFIQAVQEIGRLENLDAVQVVFHQDVAVSRDFPDGVPEEPHVRKEFLEFLLEGLNSEAFPLTKLKSLSVKNL